MPRADDSLATIHRDFHYFDLELPTTAPLPMCLPGELIEDLAQLHDALEESGALARWTGLDLVRLLDPPRAADTLRRAPLMPRATLAGRLLLGVLVLLLALTALSVLQELSMIRIPSSWSISLPGTVTGRTLVLVAGDLFVLLVWLLITIQRRRRRRLREREARHLEQNLHRVAVETTLRITERASLAAGIAQFITTSSNLTQVLAAADTRVEELMQQRERELADLSTFIAGFRTAADHLLRNAEVVDRMYAWCAELAEKLATQQQQVDGSLRELRRELQSDRTAHENTTEALQAGVPLLSGSADGMVRTQGAVAQSIELLAHEIKDLRTRATTDEAQVQTSLATLAHAADALQTMVDPLLAIPRALDEVQGQLIAAAGQLSAGAAAVRSTLIDVQRHVDARGPQAPSSIPESEGHQTIDRSGGA